MSLGKNSSHLKSFKPLSSFKVLTRVSVKPVS
uniref:Uncharacterized protein n=1 Tax=Siphoviridae sp. ctWhx86 TaxID=2826362 RepID=A0A8S5QP97_9CAUD|nr:MAG TPA: hypothetical protein [Siphoviridae sp. ctWhx86]